MDRARIINIPFGREESISFRLHKEENLLDILEPTDATQDRSCSQEIYRALSDPIRSAPLSDLVRNKKNIVIVANDITRLTPTDEILPIILEEMNEGGVSDDQIKLIIALGTHRPMLEEEIEQKYGKEVTERIEVINHNFRDPDILVDLGATHNGTPIHINKLVLDADFVLGIGSVYPHHIPGFAGGAKIIQPGVSGAETTGYTHLLGCRMRPTLLGELENPVRSEMEFVAEKSGLTHILNTVLSKDGACTRAFFGEMRAAFRSAVLSSKEVHGVNFSDHADIVVASSHPMDSEFWQAHKALYPADIVAKPDGTIILVTPCPEGVSKTHGDVTEFAGGTPADIEAGIANGSIQDLAAAALAIAWANVRMDRHISVVSNGLSPSDVEKLGYVPFQDLDSALEDAFRRHGTSASVSILPHAPETLPIATGS